MASTKQIKRNYSAAAVYPTTDRDPLQAAIAPPKDEDEGQRAERLRLEVEAKKINDQIDAQIALEREEIAKAKKRGDIKILLLGQSESGKSTTVKNFQISYSPNAWKQERKTWRAVIFLNLVRSIRRILAILDEVHVAAGGHSYHYNTTERLDETLEADDDAASVPTNLGVTSTTSKSGTPRKRSHTVATNGTAISGQSNTSGSTSSIVSTGLGTLPSHLLELSLRLSPLGLVEESLIAALSSEDPASDDFEATRLGSKDLLKGKANGREAALSAVQWRRTLKTKISGGRTSSSGLSMWGRKKNRDSGSSGSITSRSTPRPGTVTDVNGANGSSNVMNGDGEKTMGDVMDENVQYDILGTLQACADDMIRLWKDPYVRDVLKKRRFRPQDSSGFFLNDISRLMADGYYPTDGDVLNARLKTVGVIEHSFTFDRGTERGVNWTIYDVGGARNQRQAWASFFDNVDAIIFLAPISAFNQVLSEDPRVNRVADSLHLFHEICSNKLLANVNIVLFLNKIDILKSKLDAGIQIQKYILSYGDRPNDSEHACKFFRQIFGSVFKDHASPEREMYVHLTTMNDPDSARDIINNVRDMLLRKSLVQSRLI